MKRRVVILTEIIAPYRIPVFNALAARSDVESHIIFLSETDPSLRQWYVYKDEIKFSYEILRGWRRRWGKYNLLVNVGIGAALRRARPEVIISGGYSYLASWQAALWAERHKVPLLLWCESNSADKRRKHALVESLKKRFRGMCRAFVAAGLASRGYLLELGAPEGSVFVAPDAVDVEMYARSAARARARCAELRAEHSLPQRYFLYVGRLVEEKGVFDLLSAYAKLDESARTRIGLVFVGDGAVRADLIGRASQIHTGVIRFCGWVHREQISELYALAEALVFPTHSDPWGLVVNEAMACGLTIVASDVAGCVADLVRSGENGFTFRPRDIDGLVDAMRTLINQPDLAKRMGNCSFELIRAHTPEACAAGFATAVNFACDGMA
jgi:glycosyltransferase involved in cell wall biosynthesis